MDEANCTKGRRPLHHSMHLIASMDTINCNIYHRSSGGQVKYSRMALENIAGWFLQAVQNMYLCVFFKLTIKSNHDKDYTSRPVGP